MPMQQACAPLLLCMCMGLPRVALEVTLPGVLWSFLMTLPAICVARPYSLRVLLLGGAQVIHTVTRDVRVS